MSATIVTGGWLLLGGGEEAVSPSAVAASGPASLPLANFRTLLSNVGAYQTFSDTANAAEALATIHWQVKERAEDGALDFDPPFALLWEEDYEEGEFEDAYMSTGEIWCLLRRDVPSDYQDDGDADDADIDFRNQVGAIMAGLRELEGTDRAGEDSGYIVLRGLSYAESPGRTSIADREVAGDFCQAILSCPWGP